MSIHTQSTTQPPVTSQAPEQARCIFLPNHLLSHLWHHKQLHKPGACSWSDTCSATSDIPKQLHKPGGLLLCKNLLRHLGPQKHLYKPAACSCPITHSSTYDMASISPRQGPAPALSPTQVPMTSQAPAQPRGLLLPYYLLRHMWQHNYLHKLGACSCTITTQAHLTSKEPSQASCMLLPY